MKAGIPAPMSECTAIQIAMSGSRFRFYGRKGEFTRDASIPQSRGDQSNVFFPIPRLTDGTLAVALLSLILMVARLVMRYLGQMKQIFSILYDGLLTILWFHSLSLQTSADLSDAQHPSSSPWFLMRHCPKDVATACHTAKAGYALSIIAAIFYSGRLLVTVVEAVREWRSNRKGGYRAVPVRLNFVGEEGDISEEGEVSEEEARIRERDRYLYQEALSPVLAFFPEDARY